MNALETLKYKKFKDMSEVEFCIIEHSKKYPTISEVAAAELTAMQARIEKLELLLLKCKDAVEYTAEFDKEDMETYQEIIKALK